MVQLMVGISNPFDSLASQVSTFCLLAVMHFMGI